MRRSCPTILPIDQQWRSCWLNFPQLHQTRIKSVYFVQHPLSSPFSNHKAIPHFKKTAPHKKEILTTTVGVTWIPTNLFILTNTLSWFVTPFPEFILPSGPGLSSILRRSYILSSSIPTSPPIFARRLYVALRVSLTTFVSKKSFCCLKRDAEKG